MREQHLRRVADACANTCADPNTNLRADPRADGSANIWANPNANTHSNANDPPIAIAHQFSEPHPNATPDGAGSVHRGDDDWIVEF